MNWKTFKGLIVFGTLLILSTPGCTTTQPEPFQVKNTVTKDSNLQEVVNAHVFVAYLDPSVDFSRYKKILVRPLNFDKLKIDPNYDTPRDAPYELNEKDRKKIDEIFQKMMVEYLQEKGDFEVVENPGPDVLMLSVFIMKISPNAPKDDFKSRGIGSGVEIYTDGAGSITIAAGLHDSISVKPVAEIADAKNSSYMMGNNNRVSNIQDVSLMFGQWGQQLNKALINLQMNKVGVK